MILKNIKLYSIALIVVFTITSCSKDFLNLEPSTAISDKEVFESFDNAEGALVGAYDNLSSYGFDGLYNPIFSDLVGEDLMLNSEGNWGWFVAVYQLEVLANYTWTTTPWSLGYKVIYDVNKIIAEAPSIPNISDEDLNYLVGQAKAIRAYTMLKLAQNYSPSYLSDPSAKSIMNIKSPLKHDDADFPRAPLNEVYETIISDLESAKDLLLDEEFSGIFDKRGAHALLARTYLNLGEWEKARDNAVLAYENSQLVDGQQLLSGFNQANSETIFSLAYTPDDNNIYLSIPSFYGQFKVIVQ